MQIYFALLKSHAYYITCVDCQQLKKKKFWYKHGNTITQIYKWKTLDVISDNFLHHEIEVKQNCT